ncbi:hypothetical protein ABPG75_001570 [Micractinium tetrahymenae]
MGVGDRGGFRVSRVWGGCKECGSAAAAAVPGRGSPRSQPARAPPRQHASTNRREAPRGRAQARSGAALPAVRGGRTACLPPPHTSATDTGLPPPLPGAAAPSVDAEAGAASRASSAGPAEPAGAAGAGKQGGWAGGGGAGWVGGVLRRRKDVQRKK